MSSALPAAPGRRARTFWRRGNFSTAASDTAWTDRSFRALPPTACQCRPSSKTPQQKSDQGVALDPRGKGVTIQELRKCSGHPEPDTAVPNADAAPHAVGRPAVPRKDVPRAAAQHAKARIRGCSRILPRRSVRRRCLVVRANHPRPTPKHGHACRGGPSDSLDTLRPRWCDPNPNRHN